MTSKYTWSRMTPNPVAHLADFENDPDFGMPLCGARLDIRTQTFGDQSPSQYVPVCARCEARQRRLDRERYDGLAARYRTALAALIERDLPDAARKLAAVTSMTARNESLAWRIYDAALSSSRNNANGSFVESMMTDLPMLWERNLDVEDVATAVLHAAALKGANSAQKED